jgi:hypothetical protein
MGWQQVSKEEYIDTFTNVPTVFHSSEFNELNASKMECLYYLIVHLNTCSYGIILGQVSNNLKSPFSAPFGGIIHIGEFVPSHLTTIGQDLIEWAKEKSASLFLTFPPVFYNESFLKALFESWNSIGFMTNYIDVNAHFDLQTNSSFTANLERNARKNLNNALKYTHSFSMAKTLEEKHQVYTIIQQNRAQKGFPLRMTFEDLERTNTIVPIDYFLLEMENNPSAAAVVFSISPQTVMVVYWGNLQAYAEMRPMNLLSKLLFEHYQQLGKQFIDVGPSSENGIVNEGLAAFKRSLGCVTSEKYSLIFTYA